MLKTRPNESYSPPFTQNLFCDMESEINKHHYKNRHLYLRQLAFDASAVAAVGLLCLVVGGLLMPWAASIGVPVSWKDLFIGLFWGILGAIVPLLLRYTRFGRENATAMPIMTVLWRFGVVAVAILIAAATKWPVDNSFAASLLGCYFPFVVLESALSIRNVSQDTRQQ